MVDREIRSIGKILASAEEEGEPLPILTRAVPFKTQEELVSLANKLVAAYPNVAFVLTFQDDAHLRFTLAISPNNPLFATCDMTAITLQIKDQGFTSTTYANGVYFEREILSSEYVGKIADNANSTVFTYLKQFLPEEKDEADPYLDFENF